MREQVIFRDRADAGRRLGRALEARYGGRRDLLILALPRGGVPVAAEAARRLRAPLDVFLVRKLGVPGHPEYAMGAIATGGTRVMSDVISDYGISPEAVEAVVAAESRELTRQQRAFRGDRPDPEVSGRTVVLVDDGLATGATMLAAAAALRRRNPEAIVVAAPVGSLEACQRLSEEVDDVVCLSVPERFRAVGEAYADFGQVGDDEVRSALASASVPTDAPRSPR